jgi:UDP-N-acetylmuramate dehydrogenase
LIDNSKAIEKDIPLAPRSSIGLGGLARYFLTARSMDAVRAGLVWARQHRLPVQVLGGGSNTLFPDAGFDGLVLDIALCGRHFTPKDGWTLLTAGAGEDWDSLVQGCIERGLSGIECLSGIPGRVGATPIQNVGAYGQEVMDTIVGVQALHRESLEQVEFTNAECAFAYRQSRFKKADRDRFIITQVQYRLANQGQPYLGYAELQRYLESLPDWDGSAVGRPALRPVRQAVLTLRRKKSMVLDPADPHARSLGSFFLNPVLSTANFKQLEGRWRQAGGQGKVPVFAAEDGVKVPAAWLVEQAGFSKGQRHGGVGISGKHALALVNYGGTACQLLALAGQIQQAVEARFGVRLECEPVVVGAAE